MRTPSGVLSDLVRTDAAAPRVTFYEDTPGPSSGERIELSARVLSNWVSKAANALQEEWDIEPGTMVGLALPPHWRSLYWALAVWSVGGCVLLDDGADVDLTVSDDPAVVTEADGASVLVTLAALARSTAVPLPAGVMDEARELSTYADQFSPWAAVDPRDPALRAEGELTAYESVVPQANWPEGVRVHTGSPHLHAVLQDALAAWALGGSIVLSRGSNPSMLEHRLRSEGVTLSL